MNLLGLLHENSDENTWKTPRRLGSPKVGGEGGENPGAKQVDWMMFNIQ
jgi:hypothetical protein